MLEPYDGNLSSTVLRGTGGRKALRSTRSVPTKEPNHQVRSRLSSWAVCASLSILAGCSADVTDRPAETTPDLVLTDVSLIDGLGNAPISDQTIEVRGDRISSVRPSTDEDVGLNLSGHFVCPGLIDTHQHLPAQDDAALLVQLDSLLGLGITSIREMACCADVYEDVSAKADSSLMPRLYWSAFWADSVFMANDPRVRDTPGAGIVPWSLAVSAETDLDEAVRDAKQSGATGIKVYSNVAPSLLADVVRVAHAQGLQVWTHPVVFPTRPSDVVAAGSDVISHAALFVWEGAQQLPSTYNGGHPFNPFGPPAPYSTVAPDDPRVIEVLKEMRERGIILDATVSTIADSVSAEASVWAVEATRLAHGLGVPISAGTDNPAAGPAALFLELEMLVDSVGLTPLEALKSATSVGAAVLGVQDELGSIAEGMVADLVIYANDPTLDITRARHPVYVLKVGQIVRSPPGR